MAITWGETILFAARKERKERKEIKKEQEEQEEDVDVWGNTAPRFKEVPITYDKRRAYYTRREIEEAIEDGEYLEAIAKMQYNKY